MTVKLTFNATYPEVWLLYNKATKIWWKWNEEEGHWVRATAADFALSEGLDPDDPAHPVPDP